MLILFLSVFLFSMLYFVNTLYFVLSLMVTSVLLSVYAVYLGFISSLFAVMLVIIYVGAMIIFIGYICAISPNILFSSILSPYFMFLSVLPPLVLLSSYPFFYSNFSPLTDFLYSSSGLPVFILVACVLFIVLMVVSSQFFSPQGPFRSVG